MIDGRDEKCCGCSACANICPKKAIEMQYNEKGFLEPRIDMDRCVKCNLCAKACPLSADKVIEKAEKYEQVFEAVKLKDDQKRMESQSGGAFTGLAEYFLASGGVVYGVALDTKLDAKYTRVDNISKLADLKGSKYVQACTGDIFCAVEKDLKNGKKVLFSGTPCHVDGLKQYLFVHRITIDCLITVDLICHGTPSPKIFGDYIELFAKRHGNKRIKKFNFRDKKYGWGSTKSTAMIGGRYFTIGDYINIFYSNYVLRDSCFHCQYTNLNRSGDITIGDCWGIDKINTEFSDWLGVSLIIVNTKNGAKLWNSASNAFDVIDVEKEHVMQKNLYEPTDKPDNTETFWHDYHQFGPEYCFYRYCKIKPDTEIEVVYPNQIFRRIKRKAGLVYRRLIGS